MLRPCSLADYCAQYNPQWVCAMPEGCPPDDILVAEEHPFYRLARKADSYSADDFMSYAESDPHRNWGDLLPLALGLSIIEGEAKARRKLKLPMLRQYKGIIALRLNATDGVVRQTGAHKSHYTWWRTMAFSMLNLKMLTI